MVRLPLMAVSLLVPAAALSLPAAAVKADAASNGHNEIAAPRARR